MKLLPKECACEKCSRMCHAPCCGTPEDIDKLIDKGFANRLSFDDLPDVSGIDMIKPALKGYEGGRAPWEVSSVSGCTFWKNGLCELHESGLKPIQGKLVIHGMPDEDHKQIQDMLVKSWKTKKAEQVIEKWKKAVNYQEDFT
jgi:hypothetical protein